jgi:hypothetical protein
MTRLFSLNKPALFYILLVLTAALNAPAFANDLENQKMIRFTTPFPKVAPTHAVYQLLYTEAFRRLGYTFSMTYQPDERSLISLNAGKYDGSSGRIPDLETEKKYPNLLRVDEVILHHKSIGLVMDPQIQIDGWKSLKDIGVKITFVAGNQYIEKRLPNHVDGKDIIIASDISQALRMLLAGRVGIYIELDDIMVFVQIIEEFKEHRYHNAGLVDSISTFPYMHIKHRALVPKLAETLRVMKADGTYSRLIKKVINNE